MKSEKHTSQSSNAQSITHIPRAEFHETDIYAMYVEQD
jgi:hypothetical protein